MTARHGIGAIVLSVWLGGGAALAQPSRPTIALPMPDSPLVTVRLAFQVGSVDDPAGKHGLNALTALAMGQGGTAALSYEALTETLYPWAASIQARFGKEMTVIIGDVHRDHLEPFLEILRDVVVAPRFDPDDFARHRESLTNTVVSTLRGNDDEALGKEALNASIYAGHPYGTPVVGTEEGLAAISLDDVRAFHRGRYTRGTVLVGIAGGYPDTAVDWLERELVGRLPEAGPSRAPLPAPRALEGLELLVVDKAAIATAISLGFPIDVTRADDDFYALMVAGSYFGEHRTFTGLLMNKMRGERGLNYGDYAYIEHFVQDGFSRLPAPNVPRRQQYFSIWIRPVPHHNAHFALRQAVFELRRLVDHGLSEDDFETTREFLLNYTKLHVQTTSRRLGYHLDSAVHGTGYFIDEIQRRLPRLTVDDVNAAVRRHLQYDDLAIAVVTADAAAFRDQLLADAPSPPTYNMEVPAAIAREDETIATLELPFNADRATVLPVAEMFRTAPAASVGGGPAARE